MTDMQVRPLDPPRQRNRPCEPLPNPKNLLFFCTSWAVSILYKTELLIIFRSSDRSDAHLASRDAVLTTPKHARAR